MNGTPKAMLIQLGNKPAMIQVGMRENQKACSPWVKRELSSVAVVAARIALKHSAINQEAERRSCYQVT
jgi:hypothetical protein